MGEYDASTGATINAAFINGQGLSGATKLALDGHNHLFVTSQNTNTVGEYDATTGATINANFINGQVAGDFGLAVDGPNNHLFVSGGNTSSVVGEFDASTGGGNQHHVDIWRELSLCIGTRR